MNAAPLFVSIRAYSWIFILAVLALLSCSIVRVNGSAAAAERETYYIVHGKAKILAKLGDKEGAVAAARRSTELAIKAEGPKSGYVKMNDDLLPACAEGLLPLAGPERQPRKPKNRNTMNRIKTAAIITAFVLGALSLPAQPKQRISPPDTITALA